MFAGVDVGGARKGFHVAVLGGRAVADVRNLRRPEEVAGWLGDAGAALVGVDSPCSAAPAGQRWREGERELARAVCGIRWTPDADRLAGNPYYEWVERGFELYRALESLEAEVIEVFPTASWTRWAGGRGARSRARWSADALRQLGLDGVPRRLSQDDRDAIAAALTARLHAEGRTERFGSMVVPTAQRAAS